MNRVKATLAIALLLTARAGFAAADLSVTVSAVPLTVEPGASGSDLVDFTVRVGNAGPNVADVIVTNTLSSGLVIPAGLGAIVSQGFFDPVSGRWDVGFLSEDESATLQIPARAVAGASGCLSDSATVDFASGIGDNDPEPDNDTARANIGAPACADLVVTSDVEESRDGDCLDVTQQFSVTNRGPNAATAVKLVVTRYEVTDPDNFDEASCTGGQLAVPGPTTITFGTLTAGQTREFNTGLRDLQRSGPDIRIAYAVNVESAEPDPDAANGELDGSFVVDRGSSAFGDSDGVVCIFTSLLRNTSLADELPLLRRFRDRYLMTNATGRMLVDWYWQVSPLAVRLVDRNEAWREVARYALVPVIYVARYPGVALGVLLLAGLMMLRRVFLNPSKQ